ncbi:MAG TPA: FecR domain-containing protein [Enhygromyxa sp.]|nr:FecR domain-containing protein [Enhygromyxa sp.]
MTDRTPDDVVAKLRELDSALERRGVPSERSERVRRALEQRALEQRFAGRLRWWPALAFAAGAAVMAAVLLHEREDTKPSEAPELVEAPPLDVAPEHEPPVNEPPVNEPVRSCAPAKAGVGELAAGECVSGDGVRLSALMASRYEWAPDRVVLRSGELLFDVESRPERPLEVDSGAATIEVVGTTFVVHRDAELGWISLLEGHVRVRVGDRAAVDLREGEQLEWSQAPARKPVQARVEHDEGLAELLEEVAGLRRRGEYQAAVDRLRADQRKGWSARGRQLVSYEIGTLLERQLQDFDAACEHWADHRQRFPSGRYESIIARSMTRMGCADR